MFSADQVERIEKLRAAKYVCDTTHKDIHVAVFYGRDTHPVSGSRYFALYYDDTGLLITDGSFIESQELAGVVANNGDVIYSRHRHDYRYSPDKSVFIDGGREYTRTNTANQVTLLVRDGVLRILEDVL
jgi:hypothetical protein